MPRRCGRAPWRRGAPRPYVVHIGLTPHRWGGFSRENWEFETHSYNIINEQELLEAGDQLVEYLAQHAQATPRGTRPTGTAAPRTAPPLRLVRRTTA